MDTDYKLAYNRLSKAVKLMLNAEKDFLKSTSDQGKRKTYFALRDEVMKIIEPKQTNQAHFEFLAK